jgi:hypothetical protein
MFPDTMNKNIYVVWVGISTIVKLLEHLWCKRDMAIPYGHDQHTIKGSLTQGTRIHMVYILGSQRFSIYYNTSSLRVKGPRRMVITYIPSDGT